MLKKLFLLLFVSLFYSSVHAQNITPKGHFLKDSVQIGEPVAYVLRIKYPRKLEVVFPDSLHNFSPFELARKTYFPTRSDSLFSIDSAVYYLSTFEIDTVQYLKMPVYLVNEFDSTTLWTNTDSIILQHVVTAIPDSVTMKTNTDYVEVPMAFNYPYYSIGIVLAIVLLIGSWLVFGKKIRKKIKQYRLRKKFERFESEFDKQVQYTFKNCESILKLWKGFMETVSEKPYKKLTTKEIVALNPDNNYLKEALTAIDRNIYGPKDESLLEKAYINIKETAFSMYHEKMEEIANG